MNRRPDLEEEVKKTYDIESEVWHDPMSSNDYKIKIVYSGKEAILHETMKNGLTKYVVLTTDRPVTYKKYFEAEQDAIEYLKG